MKKLTTFIRNHWKLITLLTVLILIAVIWTQYRRQQNAEELTFVRPEKGKLVRTLEVSGVIMAKEHAKLRFAAGGKIVYLGAKPGDAVKKHQTLATIDQRSLQKNLEKSLNNYSKERLDWEQTLDNTEDRWLPEDETRSVQKNQFDLNNSVLDVELTSISITDTVLRSPIDGILISQPTNITGVNLLASDLFEVVNPQSLIFQAAIDELDIALVKHRQPVKVLLDSYPEEELESNVDYISYTSTNTGTGNVYLIEIPLQQFSDINRYRIGMSGDAIIELESRENALYIPIEATIERDGKIYVNVKTGEKEYLEREISTGLETDDYIEVLGGLTERDQVLLPE